MSINGIAFLIGTVLMAITGWCAYWAGRNDEREMWERRDRDGR